jgi:hypothetical protein
MAKLHELLAVEADLEGTYKKILEETEITFTKKQDHFFGFHRQLRWFAEEEGQEEQEGIAEHKEMVTTVAHRLSYQQMSIVRFLDAVYQKELSNQHAVADLIVDGDTIAKDVPATFLLGLETKLKKIRRTYELIPTLPPGFKWEKDTERGDNVYKNAIPEETYKQVNVFTPQILYKHTDKHPAQVDKIQEKKNVGKFTKDLWYGMLSSADKSKLLGKVDTLLRAVKQARQRANRAEVSEKQIGEKLFEYING